MKYIKLFEYYFAGESNNVFVMTDSYQNGDYHQSIIDVAYDKWREKGNGIDSYNDMLDYVRKTYGKTFDMLIQIGNYNYQVENGGHSQYWLNGYASSETSGFANVHKECGNLDRLINDIESSLLPKKYPKITSEVLAIMKKFREILEDYDERCDECDGQGYTEESCYDCHEEGKFERECWECDGTGEYEGETCDECGGSGEIEEDCESCDGQGYIEENCYNCQGGYVSLEVDHLDTLYYEINDKWMEICNEYAGKLIKSFFDREKLFKNASGN